MNKQEELFEISKKLVPGGVHSPVRSFKGLKCTPRFMARGDGAYIYDIDGKEYIDFCMSFGPLILGHQDRVVKEKIVQALNNGWSFGTCEPYSVELAKLIIEKIPHLEQIRFVNSGTEAVMTALRLARGYTGKNKIVKFNGCYHGHTDSMLIKAGSGLAGTSEASSKGITKLMAEDTLIVELNDLAALNDCFKHFGNDIAAVIIEPLPANNGLLIQDLDYLKGVREITKKNKSLLIFDEVISGLRVAFGGMVEKTKIIPDITTYGKIIGGGMPVGAIAGKSEIMSFLAPIGPVYQAGTLSANPLAMVAGIETLKQLTSDKYKLMKENTQKIIKLFERWFKEYNGGEFKMMNAVSDESLFWFKPVKESIKSADKIPSNLMEHFVPMFDILLKKGIYLAPNAYEVGFVSTAHNENVIADLEKRLFS